MEKAHAPSTKLEARELRDTLRQLEARRIQAVLVRDFIIQPDRTRASFLNVKGVDLNLSKDELLAFVHERRRE